MLFNNLKDTFNIAVNSIVNTSVWRGAVEIAALSWNNTHVLRQLAEGEEGEEMLPRAKLGYSPFAIFLDSA